MSNPQQTFVNTVFDPDSFCGRKREVVFQNTLLYQLEVLKTTGRYDAFKLKWHPSYSDEPNVPPVPNHLFWDSDVAKWIEGACYFLQERKSEEIENAVHELVEMIRSAQQPDGYLNIHFTVVEPDKRFTNLRDLHELYNAGHLIEAALAHESLYHNSRLLAPISTYVALLARTLGPAPEQLHGYPGHPEIELALLRLYQLTRDPSHLQLATYFLAERGNPAGADGKHYYDVEAEKRGERFNERPHYYPQRRAYWYQQAHLPLAQQQTIEGHAVRATYLLTAAADLARVAPDALEAPDLRAAAFRLWRDMVARKMYLTGGIGAVKQWEGFGGAYSLPQGTDEGGCYAETCASIGAMMLGERLLQLALDGAVADVVELQLFNAVLTGMSCDGKSFTYVNQLASSDSDASRREEWFTCACCPPNVARLLGYLGGYFWTSEVEGRGAGVAVHLYGKATLTVPVGEEKVVVKQASEWPWDGKVEFETSVPEGVRLMLKLRIPGWAEEWEITPAVPNAEVENGYLYLSPAFVKENSHFQLNVPMKPRIIRPHPFVNQPIVAVARGPIVYCAEDVDNPWVEDHFKSLIFDPTCKITETLEEDPASKEKYVSLTAHNCISFLADEAATPTLPGSEPKVQERQEVPKTLKLVPYYFRANRGGKGHMRVGLRRKT